MIICDRCFKRGDYVKAVDSIKFDQDRSQYALCESCKIELQNFIEVPIRQKPGPKPKKTTGE